MGFGFPVDCRRVKKTSLFHSLVRRSPVVAQVRQNLGRFSTPDEQARLARRGAARPGSGLPACSGFHFERLAPTRIVSQTFHSDTLLVEGCPLLCSVTNHSNGGRHRRCRPCGTLSPPPGPLPPFPPLLPLRPTTWIDEEEEEASRADRTGGAGRACVCTAWVRPCASLRVWPTHRVALDLPDAHTQHPARRGMPARTWSGRPHSKKADDTGDVGRAVRSPPLPSHTGGRGWPGGGRMSVQRG